MDVPFSDAAVLIGDAHRSQGRVCQDYAGSVPGLAAVSDGCSMSGSTDWGARLWVRAALSASFPDALPGVLDTSDDRFVPIRTRVREWSSRLGLESNDLDATLGVVARTDSGIQAWCLGDGVMAVRNQGSIEAWVMDWAGNMPGYSSYLLDPDRKALFIATSERRAQEEQRAPCRVRHVRLGSNPEELDVVEMDAATGLLGFGMQWAQADAVLVMSDGVEQVQACSWEGVVSELMEIKAARQGAFITRRLLRASHGWPGWADDISVAALAGVMEPGHD